MRITFVITGLGTGGAEKMVTSIADSLVVRGHEVLIIYMVGEASMVPASRVVGVVGLEVHSVCTMIRAYFRLRNILRTFQPDVVNSHLVHANILTRLVRLTTHIPKLITSAHNTNEEGKFRMLMYRMTDSLSDISTNVSDEAVSAFIEQKAVRPGRMMTVHNGVCTSSFCFSSLMRLRVRQSLRIADNCRLILAVGRLDGSKDYPNLFQALQQLDFEAMPYKVYIAGDGPLRGELESMLQKLQLADHVEFLGVRRDVAALMSAADVFVLSSAWEGFGLVVAEAMACQRVVVATDCGGVNEVVGEAGYLVAPHQPKALAAALATALTLAPDAAEELGRAARQRVKHLYSLEAAVDKWVQLYSDVGFQYHSD